jgi:hypothetical protein
VRGLSTQGARESGHGSSAGSSGALRKDGECQAAHITMWDMHGNHDGELHCPRERAPTPMPTGPYRDKRRGLVLWIANKANRFSLKTMTIHYAANYLDRCAGFTCGRGKAPGNLMPGGGVRHNRVLTRWCVCSSALQGHATCGAQNIATQVPRGCGSVHAHRGEVRGQCPDSVFASAPMTINRWC